MTPLKDKIQHALDESRMLILGVEILIGFEFTATFQDGFGGLPSLSRNLNSVSLTLLLMTMALLIWPAIFHQMAEMGQDTVRMHRFTTRVMDLALVFFGVGLGMSIYIPAVEITGVTAGGLLGVVTTFAALVFWYGSALLRRNLNDQKRKERRMTPARMQSASSETPLHDKIRQVLTEARVIIPGNQALLGFQFAVVLQQGFRSLPQTLKMIHLVSLVLIALSTIFLLTPAAYHRVVENGEETARFYRVAHVMVLLSLPTLAGGMCGDFLLVVYKMTNTWSTSLSAGGGLFCVVCTMWFGYTYFCRNHWPTRRAATSAGGN
jgi:hypothetical protein